MYISQAHDPTLRRKLMYDTDYQSDAVFLRYVGLTQFQTVARVKSNYLSNRNILIKLGNGSLTIDVLHRPPRRGERTPMFVLRRSFVPRLSSGVEIGCISKKMLIFL